MSDVKASSNSNLLDRLMAVFLGLPWLDVAREVWKIVQNVIHVRSVQGMYEVLEYESTLELNDRAGRQATFKKREKVHYLQDNVIAYQDQAWGDGEILLNYRCTPGTPVDRYRSGHKTHILVSRRQVKNKGDIDEFNIEWGIRGGFMRSTEQWETHVQHKTTDLKISVIFPKGRPPQRVTLMEGDRQRSHTLGKSAQAVLPDGRSRVTWETTRPRLYENYILQWQW
jgi:hypothetical protein